MERRGQAHENARAQEAQEAQGGAGAQVALGGRDSAYECFT